MPQCSLPKLSVSEQELLRIRLQECGTRNYADAPPCPQGIASGAKIACDCKPIKDDPHYAIQEYTCMARIPCPIRVMAGLPAQREVPV
ncbi:MAG: hypothetical protein ACAH17_01445 [Candidatus Paceibacterota bacterium]